MIRSLLSLFLMGILASSVWADTQVESFFDHRFWDVGTVPRVTTYHHYFQVTNTTAKPIHIASIRVSCGCVSASAVKTELAPGEQTTIVAQIETRRFTGLITKTIFVLFDQPTLEEVRLNVQANIFEEMSINPGSLAFGKIKKGATPEQSVVISFASSRHMNLEKATSESGYVQVKVEPLPSDGTGMASYRLTAKLLPTLPVGNWYCTIWVGSENRNQPPVNLAMSIEITP